MKVASTKRMPRQAPACRSAPSRQIGRCATILLLLAAAGRVEAGDEVRFNRDIRPLLFESCAACHGADAASPPAVAQFLQQQKREQPFLLVASFINPHYICEWARGP